MIQVKGFFDPDTNTMTYAVWHAKTHDAVVIDPVLNYDPNGSVISFRSVDELVTFVAKENLHIHAILETHAHADHLSGAQELKKRWGNIPVAIGREIRQVQKTFKDIYELPADFAIDGSQFDKLLEEGSTWRLGALEVKTLFTPGHTPACSSYLIGDCVFTGDALFMPDYGTGRCDFPAGSAETLYDSITQKLFTLPTATRVFTGHDYLPNGRELKFESTVGKQREANIQLNEKTTRDSFVAFRKKRDSGLSAPKLLFPSVQVNVDAGHLPEVSPKGKRFLKIPVFG